MLFVVLLVMLPATFAAFAQVDRPRVPRPTEFDAPSDRPPVEPLTDSEESLFSIPLPEIPEPSLSEIQGDDPGETIFIGSIEFEGNTAIASSELRAAVDPFLGRALAAEGIEALRRRITQVYVRAGYVNSGATIPSQDIREGRIRVRIVEGQLVAVRLSGLAHYRDSVLRDRILRGIQAPLNVKDIEEQIRLLDQDPRIAQINARLRPGGQREEAVLEVAVRENDPKNLRLIFDNYESPSIGAYAGLIGTGHDNVFGFGDRFDLEVTRTEGLTRVRSDYEIPVHASGTRLFVEGSFGLAELVDNQFRELDVSSTDLSLGVGIGQTLWHTVNDRVDIAVGFERRRSKTEIEGDGFSFVPGPQSGRSEISVVRATSEWTHRGIASALSIRSLFSIGTDWLNPTTQHGDTPDGIFFSWYGQARGVYRFQDSGVELRLRVDVQLTDRPLLSLEQFALGGPGSVRGYRRNQYVRDQGAAAALDIRVPVWRAADARTIVALTPFTDLGYAWDQDRGDSNIGRLSSVGLGIEWRPIAQLEFGLEWAYGFRDVDRTGDLQDKSVYLRAIWRVF